MTDYSLALQLPGGVTTSLALSGAPGAACSCTADGTLRFALPAGKHAYLSSTGDTRFDQPPRASVLPFKPNRAYELRGHAELDGGTAGLWIIEYDSAGRLCQRQWPLCPGPFALRWTTHDRHAAACLALRIAGTGRLRLTELKLHEETPAPLPVAKPILLQPTDEGAVRTGPAGRFRDFSIFFDPAGYKPYVARHHHFYDGREWAWYSGVAKHFVGMSAVLELGCGPGLLLAALRDAGVAHMVGLERDPVYLADCRARGVEAFAHDLNEPFPFLASASFDGVVAHATFDYLAPIAARTTLRECQRVLKPGGRLYIVARHDAHAGGDETRSSVPLTADLMRQLLDEAGFEAVEITTRERNIEVQALRPVPCATWQTRTVTLRDGTQLHPWTARQDILGPTPDAWDNASARDFTLLATPRKDELRLGAELVAYYTGYRREQGNTQRGICRAVSADGLTWRREPHRPVLTGGVPGAWDDGGVAAGSVLPWTGTGNSNYIMYFTGRTSGGLWPGIGVAFSSDGVQWEKSPERVLAVEDYPALQHLALADVIQTAAGHWLMHCEGWLKGVGWSVVQAVSDDGLRWRPTQTEPVLHPRDVPWGGRHVANPKCLEPADGHFVLGFNAADETTAFQLGLAESDDARHWRPLPVNPVLCATTGDFRIESLFLTRQAWQHPERRVYFFSARTKSTDESSHVIAAHAAEVAEWPAERWATTRWGLYRIQHDQLHAQPGATTDGEALTQSIPLERETQVTFCVQPGSAQGRVRLICEGGDAQSEMTLFGDGRVLWNAAEQCAAAPTDQLIAACFRVVRPTAPSAELVLGVWHGPERRVDLHVPIGFVPQRLRVAVSVPPDEPALTVDHLDVWQPPVLPLGGTGDAHVYMGVCRSGDPLLPDIDGAALRTLFAQQGLGRALVMPYGSRPPLDSFDQISPLVREWPGHVFPLLRAWPQAPARASDAQFRVLQLELLWQKGLLYGLKVHLGTEARPDATVLEWLEKRQVLTLWHATSAADLDWLETDVLKGRSFPVLLSHFGGYPLDRTRYARCVGMLDRYPQLHLVTSLVFFAPYLADAIRRHPTRVVLGSDFPAVSPAVARAAIEQLDLPADHRSAVCGENLRFLTERVAWHRWNALRAQRELLFPPLPETPADVVAQGFEIVPPTAVPPDEDEVAKTYWSQHVSSFYVEHKPWATMVADLAHDLGCRSVLEFGCHVGRNLLAIRERLPDARLVGLDINAAAVSAGRAQQALDLRVGDERTLAEFREGEFDFVFTVSVLDHIPDIRSVSRELVRVAARHALFLEVTLPVEGKVVRHFDHQRGGIYPSTTASYSWFVARFLSGAPRLWRLDARPCYLHAAALGPYYCTYLAFLEPPSAQSD